MAMPLVVPRYTLADLDSFPDDGHRYELLDGVLLVTPGPAPLHEVVVSRIARALMGYLPEALATVFTRGSVDVEPNVHLEPDALVIPNGEFPGGTSRETRWTTVRKWWLAVEVSGQGSGLYDRDHKGPAYLALGVREVWRADLGERCLYVSRPGTAEQRYTQEVRWHPPERPEPLVLQVEELFR